MATPNALYNLRTMKEIALGVNADDPKLIFTAAGRNTCIKQFMVTTGKSVATANRCFNQIVGDLREILPIGQYAMDILESSKAQEDELNELIKELKTDLNDLKSGNYGYDLGEKAGSHDAKTDVVDELIKAIGQKANINKVNADIVGKIMKVGVEQRRNELTEQRDQHTQKSDAMSFDLLKEQLDGLKGLRTRLGAKPRAIDTDFIIIEPKQLEQDNFA